LLTRTWGNASWQTRAQLIKAADWLIRLETIRAVSRPAKAASGAKDGGAHGKFNGSHADSRAGIHDRLHSNTGRQAVGSFWVWALLKLLGAEQHVG
jgi:hypothetical protein